MSKIDSKSDPKPKQSFLDSVFSEEDQEKLRSSIGSKMTARIDFLNTPDGIQAAITSPVPKDTDEILIPSVPEASAGVPELVEALRPKVRLGEGKAGQEDVLRAILDGQWSRKVCLLVPANAPMNPNVAYALAAQVRKQPWLGLLMEFNTIIQRARNVLAQRFLASEAEWSVWMDSDIIAPFKDKAFFYDAKRLNADETYMKPQFVDVMAIERLLKAKKSIIGAVYQMRMAGKESKLVIQPALHPRNTDDKNVVEDLHKHGPQDKIIEVGYVATGFALVHRKVYEDIMARNPEMKPKEGEPFNFFGHDMNRQGEDVAFCELAAKAGHKSWLDCSVFCAHLGTQAFFPSRR